MRTRCAGTNICRLLKAPGVSTGYLVEVGPQLLLGLNLTVQSDLVSEPNPQNFETLNVVHGL